MHLLVIEDERALCETIVRSLRRAAYSVDYCCDGEEALELLEIERYDLVLLDLNLPGKDGMTVLRTLRQKDRETKVLILSARSEVEDKVEGLDAGANDYLAKPFSYAELLGRVKALLRRYQVYQGKSTNENEAEKIIEIGSIKLNTAFNEIVADGNIVEVSDLEYKILRLMMQHPGKIFSAQNIYESVWREPYFYTCGNTVMVHIRKLRTKIEPDPQKPQYVKTVWGKGYRFEDATVD